MAQGSGPLDQQRGPNRAEQAGLQESVESPTYQGWITKWPTDGKKLGTRKRRFLVLVGHTLSYYESEDAAGKANAEAKGSVVLTADSTVGRRDEPPASSSPIRMQLNSKASAADQHQQQVVVVKTPSKELCFRSEKEGEEGEWIRHIKDATEGLAAKDSKAQALRAAPAAGASPLSSSGPGEATAPQELLQAGVPQAATIEPPVLGAVPTRTTGMTSSSSLAATSPAAQQQAPADQAGRKMEQVSLAEQVGGVSSSMEASRVPEGAMTVTPQLSGDTGLGGGSRSDGGTIVHVASSEAAVALNLEDEKVSGWVKKNRRKYFLVLQGHTLDFFHSTSELYANKPAKETILLTPDCMVESRKLPAKIRTASGSGPASPESPFTDSHEPDSVIDLHMGGQTHTLQCFSVEEENRWISHLQIAIGSLGGTYDPLKAGIGPDGKLIRRPGDGSAPRACCSIS